MFSKYKNVLFDDNKKTKEYLDIKIIKSEDYLENNVIIQGNNIHNMKNLKNFKNENTNIIFKSPINKKQDQILSDDELNEDIKKHLFYDKSNSITNSNTHTNPSTVYKSDSIKHNFQQGLAKDKPNKHVKYFILNIVSSSF